MKESQYYPVSAAISLVILALFVGLEIAYRDILFKKSVEWMKEPQQGNHKAWSMYSLLGGGHTDAAIMLVLYAMQD